MAEYIDREAAIAAIMSEPPDAHYPHWYADKIKAIPAADVAPVRHGRWGVDGVYVICSVCKRFTLSPIIKQIPTFKYCPNCGAKMDGGDGNSAMT